MHTNHIWGVWNGPKRWFVCGRKNFQTAWELFPSSVGQHATVSSPIGSLSQRLETYAWLTLRNRHLPRVRSSSSLHPEKMFPTLSTCTKLARLARRHAIGCVQPDLAFACMRQGFRPSQNENCTVFPSYGSQSQSTTTVRLLLLALLSFGNWSPSYPRTLSLVSQ